jgi:hypothetical protein
MAEEVAKGVESTGAEVKLYQVAETLPKEVLEVMHAPAKPDIPVVTFDKLEHIASDADGIIFGFPTRYGMMPGKSYNQNQIMKITYTITLSRIRLQCRIQYICTCIMCIHVNN